MGAAVLAFGFATAAAQAHDKERDANGLLPRDPDKKLTRRDLAMDDRRDFFRPIANLFGYFFDRMYKPDTSMLLPPALPDEWGGVQRMLVMNLEGTLVHTEYRNDIYKTQIRPFTTTLINDALSLGYELVIFANEQMMKVEAVLQVVDPQQKIPHRLDQEQCTYIKGRYVKDLSRLNRDLKNIILIDYQFESWTLQPENALSVKRFRGKADKALVEVSTLLELINENNIEDVRPVLTRMQEGESLVDLFGERARDVYKLKMEKFRKELVDIETRKIAAFARVTNEPASEGPSDPSYKDEDENIFGPSGGK